jgi:acyl-CoA thioester hydrolase
MNIWYPVQIRFRDLDPLSHVNNAVFFTYFEEARSYYFDSLRLERWPSSEQDQLVQHSAQEETLVHTPRIRTTSTGAHYGILIKENTCTYELPIVHADEVEIGIEVSHVGRSSIIMHLQIRARQEPTRLFATGRTVMVWCNYRTGRPAPVPPILRAAFERIEGRSFALPD